MTKYELLLCLPGTFDENEAKNHIQDIIEIIKTIDPETELNTLGKMRLAYPIKQIRYGYYYTVVFQSEPTNIPNLQEKLRLRNDVLRRELTYFNTNFTATKKIAYSTSEAGVTTMVEKNDNTPSNQPVSFSKIPEQKIDLQDIDKRLNEILDSDLMSGI